jgi:integrase/recombinase XerD
MRKRKLLSKEKIQQIVRQHKQTIPEIEQLGAMAEAHRREIRSRQRPRKRKDKQQLRSTDYLSVEQFAKLIRTVKSEADAARARSPYLCRAVMNEMLIILMAETGLRASEICNLKIKNLPAYHGKPVIEVECGKWQKSRTVGVSEWFASQLTVYVNRYLYSASPESWLFRSERGGPIKYRSIYAKVKRIGIKSGIWLYRKDGRLTSRFSPHKLRHSFGTTLLNSSNNTWLVQIALGHTKTETSQIYARTLSEKTLSDMNKFHAYLWSQCEQ